jgi:hypothetical protein
MYDLIELQVLEGSKHVDLPFLYSHNSFRNSKKLLGNEELMPSGLLIYIHTLCHIHKSENPAAETTFPLFAL